MNMKMYSDPAIELFSSTLMSAATLVTLPKAAQVFLSLFAMVCMYQKRPEVSLP